MVLIPAVAKRGLATNCCSHLGVDFEMKAKMILLSWWERCRDFICVEVTWAARAGARASTRHLQLPKSGNCSTRLFAIALIGQLPYGQLRLGSSRSLSNLC